MVGPKTHDYTRGRWDHDYTIVRLDEGGVSLRLIGWGVGVRESDYLLLRHPSGATRYLVTQIDYYPDPPDMWQAELTFAPRESAAL